LFGLVNTTQILKTLPPLLLLPSVNELNKPMHQRLSVSIPHIKELEDAVIAEREACAKIADIAEPYNSADLIRARGQA
jgi:hypothetical protein